MKHLVEMKRKQLITGICLLLIIQVTQWGLSKDYIIYGHIESLRKGKTVTLLFKEKPFSLNYHVLHQKESIGHLYILSIMENKHSRYNYRVIGIYSLKKSFPQSMLRSGTDVALVKTDEKFVRDFSGPHYVEKMLYKRHKFSAIDNREMLLVPEGNFIMGSDSGDRDEQPRQRVYVKGFYIDKYEVSNADYKKYMDAANAPEPRSWTGNNNNAVCPSCPVLVTYHEARAYAAWAKKRLPTEKEWEKAASGNGSVRSNTTVLYPWGNMFSPASVNSREFWQDAGLVRSLKKKYPALSFGLMPVKSFSKKGASPYGAVNMSGNASEWTSSWYKPYQGNTDNDKRYGRQYKVIRGGAFYDKKYKVRVTNREPGGIPNLYTDNIAGFRCVQDITIYDIKRD